MTLFERIKLLASNRNKNMKEVAIELGFSENLFYRWKTTDPKGVDLEKVADYFNVSVDYLLGRTDIQQVPEDSKENELTMFFRINTEDLTPEDKEDLEQDLKDFMEMRARRLRERKKK